MSGLSSPVILTRALPLLVCAVLNVPIAGAQPGGPQAGAMPPAGQLPPVGMPGGAGGPPGGMPPGGGPGGPEGMMAGAGGMMMAPQGGHNPAAIYISEGVRQADKEYGDSTVVITTAKGAEGISGSQASGVLLTSTNYSATGLVLADGSYQLGGDKDYYRVYTNLESDYVGSSVEKGPDKIGSFNSVLLFGVKGKVSADATINSTGVEAVSDSILNVDNVFMQVDGAQRYVTSSLNNSTVVYNDSYLVSTGDAIPETADIELPFSNAALLIDGGARTNFSGGNSKTYYFNSTLVAEGWASLSTDACSNVNVVAYNTHAVALNGGYGTYADFNCHVQLFGSELDSAEIGAIIAKSGRITVQGGNALPDDAMSLNKGKKTSKGSLLRGGRHALMMHTPDMGYVGMGEPGISQADYGFFVARDSTLETTRDLKGTYDYNAISEAAQKYVEYTAGDVILMKSTSGLVDLENTQLKSYNGVLIHSALNSDKWSNYLAAGDNWKLNDKGETIVKPLNIRLRDMKLEGDILHDDYQRNMEVELNDVTLEGRINQGSYQSWKAIWATMGVTEASWLPAAAWTGSNSLSVDLQGKSRWTVTQDSAMSKLVVGEDVKISAPTGYQLVMTINGQSTEIKPGTYEGSILLALTEK